MPTASNVAAITLPSINERASLLKGAQASFLLHLCVGGICELFKPKTSLSKPNSQLIFKEDQTSPTFHGFKI